MLPTRSTLTVGRFGMAEQAINAIYLLGEQPDAVCDSIIKNLTSRVFDNPVSATPGAAGTQAADEDSDAEVEGMMDVDDPDATATQSTPKRSQSNTSTDMGDAFQLSQLVFVVGHVAIKHIVYLELIERELKRRRDVAAKGNSPCPHFQSRRLIHIVVEKGLSGASPAPSKDGEELDQVAGNAEDEIGDLIVSVREEEMMYSEDSILADFGPMIKHICLNPKQFKVCLLHVTIVPV